MIRLKPTYPTYLLNTFECPPDESHYIPLTKVFKIMQGFSRTLANFTFCDSPQQVIERHREFREESIEYIKTKYFPTYFCKYLGKSFGALSHPGEIMKIAREYPAEGNIHPIAYVAFHYKYTFCVLHQGFGFLATPHTKLMPPSTPCFQMVRGRSTKPTFTPCMAFNTLCRERYVTTLELGYIMAHANIPLYITTHFMGITTTEPNITPYFIKRLQTQYRTTFSPDIIFGYIYSIMWHRQYRAQWNAFYRNDYPNLPLVKSLDTFLDLASLGYRLLTLHTQVPNLPNGGY